MKNQKQIYLYSISTDAFHNEEEQVVHNELMDLHTEKNRLKELEETSIEEKRNVSDSINKLKVKLNKLLGAHEGNRTLSSKMLTNTNKISQFDSSLTRTLNIKEKETTTDIIMVRAYHYTIFKSLIENGFVNEDGEHYQYFTSSAGMIRNKKSIFVKTSVVDGVEGDEEETEFKKKIWCGLDKDKINNRKFEKSDGNIEYGININKFNAYLALCMTSSIPFEGFDIDKAIVVKDFATTLKDIEVDHIDKKTFKVDRIKDGIEIEHLDGAGIVLPSVMDKATQFRMPHFKGLLIPFNYVDFINSHEDASPIVMDIYKKEWNVIKEDIQYIFTESQFKLAKYYSSWDEYKEAFKKGCEFVICKEEETNFIDKPVNYQTIQTLTDATTDEMKILAARTNKDIAKVGQDKDIMLRILGVNKDESKKDNFQKALTIYPELLNDQYSKESIRNTRDSMFKDAKAGKLLLDKSKRTFIAPDLYAFCEWLFMNIEKPKGLLKNGEVSCKLYNEESLDVLRSPHLFKEHCVRQNKRNDKTNKWFVTNCIYTSIHDPISKQLMFDVDGDEAHIISSPAFKFMAKRNMKGIVPLDYELATAKKETIEPINIYNSLVAAYSKNIGEVSNSISKIWNLPKDKIDEETIKQLCFVNNAIIDFCKTLWMPTVPPDVKVKIRELTNGKLAHFFKYAKDKSDKQINPVKDIKLIEEMSLEEKKVYMDNLSTVDKLEYIIEKKKIHFSKIADNFDYRFLIKKKKVMKIDQKVIDKYDELNGKKKQKLDKQLKLQGDTTNMTNLAVFDEIRLALLEINNDEDAVVDMLVEHLYTKKPNSKKTTLWKSFGDVLLRNLEFNLADQTDQCTKCETRFRKVNKTKVLCDECKVKEDRKVDNKRKKKEREKQTSDTK
ncbi:hypothetical protein [Paraliobacillus sp. X-1268]|uniref:hypothetical protein n=1 Tax=Paraliobacillus sp. X-1268 TaxID=2213193 RepID=UPI000E3EDCCE|nr:hypothetical protein [Paraliobacillus sp. X-1268]